MLDFSPFGFLARLTPPGVDRCFATLCQDDNATDSTLSHLDFC